MYNRPNTSHRHRKKGFLFLLFPLVIFAVTSIVMLLWNAILPQITGAGHINFWQALGLLVLCRILFGGFKPGDKHGFDGHRGFGPAQHWRQKWMNMSDEERDRFRQQWKQRCGDRGGKEEGQ